MQTVAVYDPLLGTTPIATYHDVSSIALPLGADPLVVELTPVPTWTPAMDGARAASKSIEATASGMLIVGAAGDTITATGNRDTFALHAGFGNETITGFVGGTAPADVIQFDKGLFDSFAAVQGAMHQVGDSVVITYDAHDQLVLNHVGMAQLSASNFLFV
jgi:Ca2+-binding RTX toxin-like protein